MPEMLQEDIEIFVGQKKVTGIIGRQTSTFLEVFIFQWTLPLMHSQLDGSTNSLPPAILTTTSEAQNAPHLPPDTTLQCETYHETFENEDQFNEHDSAHIFLSI